MEYGMLSERLEELFAEQVSDRAILTGDLFYQWESGQGFGKKTTLIGGFGFNLFYVGSRSLRHDQALLFELGIKNPNAVRYYEYCLPNSPYVRYISGETWQRMQPEVRKRTKTAPFFNYFEANPKAKSLAVNLNGKNGIPQSINITANLAPFSANHFVLWPESEGFTGLKQVYHSDMMFWIDDLFCQLDAGYSLFFSAEGSGNSVDTFHLQLLQLPFPAFGYLERYYKDTEPGLTMTSMRAWPLTGVLARYGPGTKDGVLAELDRYIHGWLSRDGSRTFNLLFRITTAGIREAFFIFREKGFTRLPGIKNEFGACEAGGNLILENRGDYDGFPGETGRLELVSGDEQPAYQKDGRRPRRPAL
jgi:hypothetical protein